MSELERENPPKQLKELGATIEFLDWDDYPLVSMRAYAVLDRAGASSARPPTPTMQTQAMH